MRNIKHYYRSRRPGRRNSFKIFAFFEKLGMKKKVDVKKLDKIIKTTEFSKMQNLEKNKKFKESIFDEITGKKRPFFHLGPQMIGEKYWTIRTKRK